MSHSSDLHLKTEKCMKRGPSVLKRQLSAAIVAAGLLIGVGCSGGGAGAPVPPAPSGPVASASATLTFRIPVPSTTAGAKKPAYVSAGTQSVQFTGTGFTTETFNVGTLPSATCPVVGSFYQCTANIDAPVGSYTLVVTTYTGANATGSVLSAGSVPVTIVSGQSNPVNVTLNGVATALTLSVTQSSVSFGAPTSLTATWGANDASGFAIVGPGSITDGSGNAIAPTLTSSSPTALSVGSPSGSNWTVTYDGTDISPSQTLTLAASGVASVVKTITASAAPTPTPTATPTPTPTATPTAVPTIAAYATPAPSGYVEFTASGAHTMTATEGGYGSGVFSVDSSAPGIISVDAPGTFTASGGSATIHLTANASGSTTIHIHDTNGQTLDVPVRVTISSVTIN